MFNRLKDLFKRKIEKSITDTSTDNNIVKYKVNLKEGSELVKWKILENNPGKIRELEGLGDSAFLIAYVLFGILQNKGFDVEILNDETENNKWIYVKDNGYYLLPLLINFYYDENNELKMSATIQIHHKEIFPNGIFEYVYPQQKAENAIDGLFELFETWVDLDWLTLCDCLKFEKSEYMSMRIDLDKEKIKSKHVFYGPVLSYPNFDVEEAKSKGIDIDPYIDEFCPCCLFTNSMEAFDEQIKDTSQNYAIRLFAMKNPDGEIDADCRINGEEYPQAEKYLKNYTKTWKKCDIMKFRKQYVIIRNVENRKIIN
ncbi:DUF6348 family protein [Leptotrichia trevisanii]|uniref:Uncharacterized protein n=1 Tax=Leptotrichia trevisanii TaxID=109328 RepID=A0A510K737_9FUSO|nr:DUF6348 family protein [Leptotrichia trevisanii]BBM45643.1 hypothetical protein JMUB3870_1763 [Leptotrichia trevisanii]